MIILWRLSWDTLVILLLYSLPLYTYLVNSHSTNCHLWFWLYYLCSQWISNKWPFFHFNYKWDSDLKYSLIITGYYEHLYLHIYAEIGWGQLEFVELQNRVPPFQILSILRPLTCEFMTWAPYCTNLLHFYPQVILPSNLYSLLIFETADSISSLWLLRRLFILTLF